MVEVDADHTAGRARRTDHACSPRSKGVDSSSPTTTCGTRAAPAPSSAKDARGSRVKSAELGIPPSARHHVRVFSQGPYEESVRYAEFMDYRCRGTRRTTRSTRSSSGARPTVGSTWSATCDDGDRVFETYWTAGRGAEVLENNYALMDLTVSDARSRGRTHRRLAAAVEAGRSRRHQDQRPAQHVAGAALSPGSRPIAQWSCLEPDAPTISPERHDCPRTGSPSLLGGEELRPVERREVVGTSIIASRPLVNFFM